MDLGAVEAARKIADTAVMIETTSAFIRRASKIIEDSTQVVLLKEQRDAAYKLAADALAMPNWNQDEMIVALTNICRTLGGKL